jgi:hypothetical protein
VLATGGHKYRESIGQGNQFSFIKTEINWPRRSIFLHKNGNHLAKKVLATGGHNTGNQVAKERNGFDSLVVLTNLEGTQRLHSLLD